MKAHFLIELITDNRKACTFNAFTFPFCQRISKFGSYCLHNTLPSIQDSYFTRKSPELRKSRRWSHSYFVSI